MFCFFFFFKQKTAYEMRISDWSSDVCSSDLPSSGRSSPDSLWRGSPGCRGCSSAECTSPAHRTDSMKQALEKLLRNNHVRADGARHQDSQFFDHMSELKAPKSLWIGCSDRSEEHTSELQSLMRTPYCRFCYKKKTRY